VLASKIEKYLDIKDKKVLVVGIARSGIAVAKFLVGKGSVVVLTDKKSLAELTNTLQNPCGVGGNNCGSISGNYPREL